MNTAIAQHLDAANYDWYGLRVGGAATDGDVLGPSRRWEDGEPTDDYLYGASAVQVLAADNLDRKLQRLIKEYGCLGDCVLLVAGFSAEWGEDADEIMIQDAVVLEVFSHA